MKVAASLKDNGWVPVLVDYDGDSKMPAGYRNRIVWPELLKSIGGPGPEFTIPREWGPIAPQAVSLAVNSIVSSGRRPLLLGGSHGLTYHSVAGLVRRYGPLNILHLDAHHDRYRYPILTHFSVFYHLQRTMPIAIRPVGHRFERADAMPLLHEIDHDLPWYISLDVDYFDPETVPNVMHRVASSAEGEAGSLQGFLTCINELRGKLVVGADCVEWVAPMFECAEWGIIREALNGLLSIGDWGWRRDSAVT